MIRKTLQVGVRFRGRHGMGQSDSAFLAPPRLGAACFSSSTASQPKHKAPLPPPGTPVSKSFVPGWERTYTNFPDFIEAWDRKTFYRAGGVMTGLVAAVAALGEPVIAAGGGAFVALYWYIGFRDISQRQHTIRRNFPVLGNMRYILETLRPEIRQYFVEAENEAEPFSRAQRSMVYQRAKDVMDTMPLGTRRKVYSEGYEWTLHSMYPTVVTPEHYRVTIGGPHCTQPYSASRMNVSAMSYGALSDNAVLALNGAARRGGFYHNTGEGGLSRFHLEPGGDIVWNVGTGYFGCRDAAGKFSAENFKINAARPQVKMIEVKLSQGAKPAHGGILPGAKVTPAIAEARGVAVGVDCNSPPRHSAFSGPAGLCAFVDRLRELSGGKPVGVKLCVGRPEELAAIMHAMLESGGGPDFMTVDGGEGGTGAAPPEFSNSVGTPLVEGLTLTHDLLVGAGLRDRVKVVCSGKVLSGFSIVRNLALGADVCNAARAMMFALGCVQALKCNTNHCPTGVATQDPELMQGLDVVDKTTRVFNYQKKTVHTAFEIIGAAGLEDPALMDRHHVMLRTSGVNSASYADLFPPVKSGSLVAGSPTVSNADVTGRTDPRRLQAVWDAGGELLRRHVAAGP